MTGKVQNLITWFQRAIIILLIILIIVIVFSATLDLGWTIIGELMTPPVLLADVGQLLDTLGLFLLVLIGLELLETLKAYLKERTIHVEVVFAAAMMAVARKIIVLDVKELSGATLLGIASLVIALTSGYYLFRRAGCK